MFFTPDDAAGLIGLADRRVKNGFSAEVLTAEKARELEPALSPSIVGAVLFPEDAQVHNPKMVTALAKGAAKFGAKFQLGNPVTGFVREGERVVGVVVNGETLYADTFVIANGCWAGELTAQLGAPMQIGPAKGQIVLIETMPPLFERTIDGLGIYIVPRADGKVLIGATVEFVGYDKSTTVAGTKQLIDAGGSYRASAGTGYLLDKRGQACVRMSEKGHFSVICPGYDNVVLASGHFKNGILLAPITGQLIAELLTTGAPSLSLEPFHPNGV